LRLLSVITIACLGLCAEETQAEQNFYSAEVDSVQLQYAGSALWSGRHDILVDGDYIYCAMTNGLMVIDASDPTLPTMISQTYLNTRVNCLAKSGSTVFCGTTYSGLLVVDVSNPSRSQLVGSAPLDGWIANLAFDDGFVYAICLDSMHVIDVTNPHSPSAVASVVIPVNSSMTFRGIVVSGGVAFIAANDLYLVDISTPATPLQIARITVPQIAIDVDLGDTLALVAGLSSRQPSYQSVLSVINVRDINSPSIISSYDVWGDLMSVTVRGSYAYLAAGESGVAVFDITDRLAMQPTGCFPPLGRAYEVNVHEALAFVDNSAPLLFNESEFNQVLCAQAGRGFLPASNLTQSPDTGDLLILDVSDESSLVAVGAYPHPGYATSVKVVGQHAFVADETGGVSIVDVSGSDTLIAVSEIEGPESPRGMDVAGNILLIADQLTGLLIADVSDIAHPRIVGSASINGWTSDVATDGEYAFVAGGSQGLLVFDISEPTVPTVVGRSNTNDFAIEVIVSEQYAYVSDRYAGLRVFDLSDPTQPVAVGKYPANDEPLWVIYLAKWGNTLVLAADFEVFILDVTNPLEPKQIGSYVSSRIQDISLAGDLLFLATARNGIEVVDISDPVATKKVCTYDTEGAAMGVASRDSMLFVADHNSLLRFQWRGSSDPNGHGVVPDDLRIDPGYPNPFNPSTTIEYSIPRTSRLSLSVYNILGQKVATLVDDVKPAGSYTARWGGTDAAGNSVASGVYLCTIKAGGAYRTIKLVKAK